VTGRLFVDTSAWFALANRSDPDHAKIAPLLQGNRGKLVTTNFVFDETVTICRSRLGLEAAVRVGDALLDTSVVDLIRATPADESEAWDLFRNREDKFYSYTDCVSFAMMRRLGIGTAVALDDEFRQERFDVRP